MSNTEVLINDKQSALTPGWPSWSRYSEGMLRNIEKKILQYVKTAYRGFFVDIGPVVGSADKIWTLSMNTDSTKTPLLMLHGLGAGVALWCMNLDSLSASRPLYAIDLVGFGRSSRPKFSSDGLEAEQQLVRTIEEWRKEMKIEKFVLLGHSMGGFLATSYAITYPERVNHLILADPWGFPEKSTEKNREKYPFVVRAISQLLQPFNPLWPVRVAGPFGNWLIEVLRADLSKKFSSFIKEEGLISQYIYQCNAQTPSGESAFHAMMSDFGWAKHPMEKRIGDLNKDVPITLIYGTKSWVENMADEIIKSKRVDSYVSIKTLQAGHHIYADKPETFNQFVNEACEMSESDRKKPLAIMPAPPSQEIAKIEEEQEKEKKASQPTPDITTNTSTTPSGGITSS